MHFLNFDYLIFMIPALVLAGIATLLTKTTFARYSRVPSSRGLTGAQAASQMLRSQGINSVSIEQVGGFLSDHYDPSSNTLRLSPSVYGSRSLSAIGVACHEAGHALQKAHNYKPLMLRSGLVPLANIGTHGAYVVFMLGFLLNSLILFKIGAILFTGAVIFSVVTLPVEWNATARAKSIMVSAGIVSPSEQNDAGKVLNAAFMTYVAAAVSAIMTLLYYLLRSGLLGGRDD